MAKYDIDGVEYEIADNLDLKETVAKIRDLPSHVEAQNTVGRATKEGLESVGSAARDLVTGAVTMPFTVGHGIAESVRQGSLTKGFDSAKELSGIVDEKLNSHLDEEGKQILERSREHGGYKNLMKPVETITEAAGKYAGAATYYGGGSPEAIETAGKSGDALTQVAMVGGMLHAPFKSAKESRLAEARKHAEDIRQEKIKAYQDELAKMQAEYTRPTNLDQSLTLQDQNNRGLANTGLASDVQNRTTPFARSNPSELALEEPKSPQVEATPQEGINFPLRQEVLNQPEVKQVIDSYRHEAERMKAAGEPTAELEKAFGDYMARFGIKDAGDATGLRRKLYEHEARALPVEKAQSLPDRPVRPSDWTKRDLTPFDLADFDQPKGSVELPRVRSGSRFGGSQKGYVDARMFTDGFKFVKDAVDKLGEPIKILGMTNRATDKLEHLPDRIREFIDRNTAHSRSYEARHDSGRVSVGSATRNPKILRAIAIGKNEEPLGMAEFRPKGDYLESDWTYVLENKQGRHIATNLYTAVREEGSDIRASAAQTPQGKMMFHEFAKNATKFDESGRPILERLNKTLPDTLKGFGKSQAGAVSLEGLSKPSFEKFKKQMKDEGFSDEILKGVYERMYEKKPEPKFEATVNEGKLDVLKNNPVSKGLKEYTDPMRPLEEAKDDINNSPDISDGLLAKALKYTLSGSQFVGKVFNDPMIKWGTTKIRRAIQEHDTKVNEVLYDKDTGLTHTWRKLTDEDKIAWAKETIAKEGKNEPIENPSEFQKRLRAADDAAWDYSNKIREMQEHKPLASRPNHFPGKFLGEFYVLLTKINEETKQPEVVGWYPGNSLKEVKKFQAELRSKYPGLDVSEVYEKANSYNRGGMAHAYGVYSDLQRVIESGSPEAKMLSDVIERFQQNEAGRTAGFYQHQKAKKGLLGSSGRNEFKTDLKNAEDMMSTFQMYIHQVYEYGEFVKISKDIKTLLDKEEFPNHPNSQEYVRWYFDQARGVENQFTQLQQEAINMAAHSVGLSGATIRGMGATARGYLMWNMLSFHNTRFLLTQIMQPHQFILQNMVALANEGVHISKGEMVAAWIKGSVSAIPRNKLSAEMRADINWAEKNKVIDQSLLEDINSRLISKDMNTLNILSGNQSIRWTEGLGRKQTFMTYMELLRDKLPQDQARQVAKEFTEQVMTDFRVPEMPMLYRKLGPVGSLMSPLAKFKHNYFSQLAGFVADYMHNNYNPKYLTPFFVALGIQTVYGGLMGLPGREDLDVAFNFMKRIFGTEDNVTQYLLAKGKDAPYVTHGLLSGVTGADLSTSFGMSQALPRENSSLPLVTKSWDLLDAAIEAGLKRTNSSIHQLAKTALPTSGLAQAPLEWATRNGDIIPDPKHRGQGDIRRPDNMTDKAWLLRMGTLRSLDEAKEKAINYETIKDNNITNDRKAILMEKAYDDAVAGRSLGKYMEDANKLAMTPQQFRMAMQDYMKNRATTERERLGGLPPKSPSQMKQYQELQRYR